MNALLIVRRHQSRERTRLALFTTNTLVWTVFLVASGAHVGLLMTLAAALVALAVLWRNRLRKPAADSVKNALEAERRHMRLLVIAGAVMLVLIAIGISLAGDRFETRMLVPLVVLGVVFFGANVWMAELRRARIAEMMRDLDE